MDKKLIYWNGRQLAPWFMRSLGCPDPYTITEVIAFFMVSECGQLYFWEMACVMTFMQYGLVRNWHDTLDLNWRRSVGALSSSCSMLDVCFQKARIPLVSRFISLNFSSKAWSSALNLCHVLNII